MIHPGSLTPCSGNFCYILCAVNVIFALLTVPENAIVIAALHKISKKGKRWKIPNILMAVLAITDLLSGLISQTLYAYFLYLQARYLTNKQMYGSVDFWALLILNYSSYTLCGSSLLLVALMAIDRLHAIAYPILYRKLTYRRRIIASVVIICTFCGLIPLLRFASSTTGSAFTLVISIIVGSALIITLGSYVMLLYMFRQLQSRSSTESERLSESSDKPAQRSLKTPGMSCRDKRLTKSFAIIGGTLIFMYLPQLILKPFILSGNETILGLPISVEDIANTILYCNSFINPLLFAFRHKEIRAGIKSLTCWSNGELDGDEHDRSTLRRSHRQSVKLPETSSSGQDLEA